MEYQFRKAINSEIEKIWEIIHQAIIRRKEDGSNQWQDGYPNLDVIRRDVENCVGYVLTDNDKIIGYCAILINDEPEYAKIKGKWISENDFIVVHRVAISEDYLGQGLAQKIFGLVEEVAKNNNINSIRVDTNFDNVPMLKILDKLNYSYCGEVYFRGSARKAFEKVLE